MVRPIAINPDMPHPRMIRIRRTRVKKHRRKAPNPGRREPRDGPVVRAIKPRMDPTGRGTCSKTPGRRASPRQGKRASASDRLRTARGPTMPLRQPMVMTALRMPHRMTPATMMRAPMAQRRQAKMMRRRKRHEAARRGNGRQPEQQRLGPGEPRGRRSPIWAKKGLSHPIGRRKPLLRPVSLARHRLHMARRP